MLEKPSIPDEHIIAQLRQSYGLRVAQVAFLPLGADANTAVYRLTSKKSEHYFLKLRKDNFEATSLLVPQSLHEHGISQVIAPLETVGGQLWASLDSYQCALYPMVEGRDGFETALSDEQWVEFGAALRQIHSLDLPDPLRALIPFETWSSHWRELVTRFQMQVEHSTYADPAAAEMAAFMRDHREEIRLLVERAGELASILESLPLERVLCHADLHAGNLLLGGEGKLFIVDWDNPILAPRERDLMFIGGGVGSVWNTRQEEDLFYQGYGHTQINMCALTYYRYERIVEDIAAYCQEILLTSGESPDRRQGLRYFKGSFGPGEVLDIARRTDEKLRAG